MAEVQTSYKVVDRQIGLLGGVVLLVGTVIGMSVFLLPGALIGDAGPSIIAALLLTAAPMVFSVLLLLQLGGALPVAGGIYVYASRLVSPFWGVVTIWLVIPAIWAILLFTGIGFAQFATLLLPFDVAEPILVAAVLAVFILLNLRGVTLVTGIQLVMVVGILIGFAAFIIPGLFQIDTANYTPMFPAGVEPFLIAVVALYIPFQGYSMIIELGEELDDPIKNIPRVLLIGMALAVVLSLLLVVVFVGLDRWDILGAYEVGGVAQAGSDYLAPAVGAVVATAAILGAFTTLNALITSYSRTLMRAARDEVLSSKLAAIHPSTDVPHWAILTLTIPPLLLAPLELPPVLLSVFLALIILFGTFISAFALWNLPKRFPEAYEHSIYKLPMPVLKIAAVGAAVSSLAFWLIIFIQAVAIIVAILAIAISGYLYYLVRKRRYGRDGIDLDARLALLHSHEAGEAGATPEPADADVETLERSGMPPRPEEGDLAGRSPVATAERDEAEARLAAVPGIGAGRARALIAHFGSVEAVRAAPVDELAAVAGMDDERAHTLKERLD
jgi:basic amino acid/polyamine antiporter, APA family